MTMYNILIVDDEPLIKANLKVYLNNLDGDYNIVGDASNGKEAIAIVEKEDVHILLSDVMMPIMNGVELSAYIHDNHPDIALVMLSNYDDFSYVKTTLKNGARDYILKHTLSEDVLEMCINGIIIDLEAPKNPPRTKNLVTMQRQFILRLIEGPHLRRQDLIEELTMLEIPIKFSNLITCAIDIDNYTMFKEEESLTRINAIQTSILSLVNQLPSDHANIYITHIQEGRFILLLSFEKTHSAAKINRHVLDFLQNLKNNLNRFLNLSITISYSYICRDITDIPEAYKAVNAGINQRFVSGKNKIYNYVTKISGENEMIWVNSNSKYQLVSELNYGDEDKLHHILADIFKDLREKQVAYQQCRLLFYDLINVINQSCNDNNINADELYGSYNLTSMNLSIFDTLEEIEDFITHLYTNLYKQITRGTSNEYSDLVKRTVTYITNNYSDPFTLAEAADYLGVSKSYLSNTFKSEVGIGFNKYLTNFRIEHAKIKMIHLKNSNNNIDLEELARDCGFNSYSYFSTTFKKIEGESPLHFSNKL